METADDTAAKDWRHLPTMRSIMRHFLTNWEKMKMFHDVVFVVGDESEDKKRIGAHKLILALRSEVFSKMLYPEEDDEGDDGLTIDQKPVLERGKQIIQLGGVNSNAFRIVLSYMYSDKTPFDIQDFELAFNVILLAKRFGLEQLRETTVDIVKRMLDNRLHSAVKVFELSIAHGLSEVEKYAFEAILNNADVTLHTQHFLQMKEDNLCRVLKDDNLVVNEVELFLLVVQWAREECKRRNLTDGPYNMHKVLGKRLYAIRFPIMKVDDFFNVVLPSNILSGESEKQLSRFFMLRGIEMNEKEAAEKTFKDKYVFKLRGPIRKGSESKEKSANPCAVQIEQMQKLMAKQNAAEAKAMDQPEEVSNSEMPTQCLFEDSVTTKREEESKPFSGYSPPVYVENIKEGGKLRTKCSICGINYSLSYFAKHWKKHQGDGIQGGQAKEATESKGMHFDSSEKDWVNYGPRGFVPQQRNKWSWGQRYHPQYNNNPYAYPKYNNYKGYNYKGCNYKGYNYKGYNYDTNM